MKKKSLKIMLLFLTALLLFAVPMTVNAASTKTKAMKAYSRMLAKSKLKVTGSSSGKNVVSTYKTSKLVFATAYLDKDNVPELIVKLKGSSSSIYIFTYKKGKVVQTSNAVFSNTIYSWGYYKKKSVLALTQKTKNTTTYCEYVKYGKDSLLDRGIAFKSYSEKDGDWIYWKIFSSTYASRIDQSTFDSLVEKNTGSTKLTMLSFVKNTKKNRSRELK